MSRRDVVAQKKIRISKRELATIPSQRLRSKVEALIVSHQALENLVKAQGERIRELEIRLNQNSQTSSRPPSSDRPWNKPKTKSLRARSNRPSGGQPGHEGFTLNITTMPDETVKIVVERCSECGADLSGTPAKAAHECRQVFELKKLAMKVIEYLAEMKNAPAVVMKHGVNFRRELSRELNTAFTHELLAST